MLKAIFFFQLKNPLNKFSLFDIKNRLLSYSRETLRNLHLLINIYPMT